jgi:hypothetical protein
LGCYEDIVNSGSPWGRITLEALISYLDGLKVTDAVVLPLSSWNVNVLMPTEYALEASKKFPERLIPFCAVEVREECFEDRIKRYVDMGCRGFGEHTSKLPIDHGANRRLYRLLGRLEIPILIHLAFGRSETYGAMDPPDLNGLEKVVKEHSDVDFILHGPGWWSCISATVPPDEAYPKGPIDAPGRTVSLLESYPNIYGDISAGSGYNALSRDLDFTRGFLRRLDRKIIYGTDLESFYAPEESHIQLLESLNLTERGYANIYHENLEHLIRR